MRQEIFSWFLDHYYIFLITNSLHKHHAVQIIVGLDGPIMLTFDNFTQSCLCVMIASDTLHKLEGSQETQLHLLIDNESILARKLAEKYFQQENVYIFDESYAQQLRKRFIFGE